MGRCVECHDHSEEAVPIVTLRDGRIVLSNGEALTTREHQVLERVWLGELNREIADKLAISQSRVRQCLSALSQKTSLSRIRLGVFYERYLR